MKCRQIGLWCALSFVFVSTNVLGQDGSETDPDDCQKLHNEFYEHRDKLRKVTERTWLNVDTHCRTIACADRWFTLGAINASLGSCAMLANRLYELFPMSPGSGVPAISRTQAAKELEEAYRSIVEGMAAASLSAANIINKIKNSPSLSSAVKDALKGILPDNWENVSKDLQESLDAEYVRRHQEVTEKNTEAKKALIDLDVEWEKEMEMLNESIANMVNCNKKFTFAPSDYPKKPDYGCAKYPEPRNNQECMGIGFYDVGAN